jgi:hypothetical protein
MAKIATFVIRDEDMDKVMAAVQALHLSPPAQDDVGGFLLSSMPTMKTARTMNVTKCTTTHFPPDDGHCEDGDFDV